MSNISTIHNPNGTLLRVSDLKFVLDQIPLAKQKGQRNPPPELPPLGSIVKYRLVSSLEDRNAKVIGHGRTMVKLELEGTCAHMTCVKVYRGDPIGCPRGDCYVP